jgi:hypothetical protein
MQQERDRVVAAFAVSQQAAQTSAQAAKIRQQLALLQAEIQSMQPSQPPSRTSLQVHSVSQNQLNPPPAITAQQTLGSPFIIPSTRRTIDPKSPLSEGIQNSPWPASYKLIILPKFNGKSDPHQFIMSFEAIVASIGGNKTVLAKSFIIAAEVDVLAWYSMLKPSTVYS